MLLIQIHPTIDITYANLYDTYIMSKLITYTASDARKNFYSLVRDTAIGAYTPTISLRDSGTVVMMSLEEYESWQETLDVMSDSKLVTDINEATQESVDDATHLGELIKELGLEDEVDYPAKGKKTIKKAT